MKNIVLCFDGTGNEFGSNPTNIARITQLVEYNDTQMVYYDPGVGTVNFLGLNLKNLVWLWLGQAFGWGIIKNIVMAYSYLMDVYEEGDNLYIFGFSRGAYTARALAGVLHKVGLLRRGTTHLLPYIARLYLSKKNDKEVSNFKKALCVECTPYFLGLFDTVESRGYLTSAKYPMDASLHPEVKYAYQALSIDEHRQKFLPLLLNEPPNNPDQVVEQVWFAGCHSDVGGYFWDRDLADITLRWMLTKAESHGLQLKPTWKWTTQYNPFGSIHESRKGLWKVWRSVYRVIPENSNIHVSVCERRTLKPGYNPTNLPTKYDVVDL